MATIYLFKNMFDLGHLPTAVWRNLTHYGVCCVVFHCMGLPQLVCQSLSMCTLRVSRESLLQKHCDKSTVRAHGYSHPWARPLLKMESLGQRSSCTFNVDNTLLKCPPTGVHQVHIPINVHERDPVSPLAAKGIIKCLNICQSGRWGEKSYNFF